MTRIAGSTALVTGAASGLGLRLVQDSLTQGARVVAWDRDAAGLAALADRYGADAPLVTDVVDVTDREQVYAAASRAGTVDILLLNAGVVSGRRFLDLTDEAVETVFAVNTLALFWCTKAFLPQMVQRDSGHIVVVASLAGVTAFPGLTEYVASKHAAYGFLESLRTELADDAPGVRTTVVLPQVIGTGMFAGVTVPRMFPVLDPDEVSHRVLAAVARDRRRLLLNRPALLTAYAIRMLPPRAADYVARRTGAFDSMSGFHGRSVMAAPQVRTGPPSGR